MTDILDNADNVRAGVYDGEFYWNPGGTAMAPVDATTAIPSGFTPLGFIEQSGPQVSNLANPGTSTKISAWQRGAVIKVINTPSQDLPTFVIEFIETKPEVIEAAFGVEPDEYGGYVIDGSRARPTGAGILDVIDMPFVKRYYAPNLVAVSCEVTGYGQDKPEGYKITFEAQPSTALDGGQVKVWDKRLSAYDTTPPEPDEPDEPGGKLPARGQYDAEQTFQYLAPEAALEATTSHFVNGDANVR